VKRRFPAALLKFDLKFEISNQSSGFFELLLWVTTVISIEPNKALHAGTELVRAILCCAESEFSGLDIRSYE
jgi:hypothetical protein